MSESFSDVWRELLKNILDQGRAVAPRGKPTLELPQRTIEVSMSAPVLTVPSRKLNYQFMAAEAYWILSGDNRVENIAPWNKHIAQFSDDGKVFFGAYGPKVVAQLPYVIKTLLDDPDSRQAGLTIWRESPQKTKDVPCTVAMFFNIRDGQLNNHVFMRSSDAWLGIPYDVFTFSMLGVLVCSELNEVTTGLSARGGTLKPGTLHLTAASSHLYEPNWNDAQRCVLEKPSAQKPMPAFWCGEPRELYDTLRQLRDSKPGDSLRWWEFSHG